MAIEEKLAADNPSVTELRSRLAGSHNGLGGVLSGLGKPSEAEAELRASLSLYQDLVEANPTFPEYRNLWASGHTDRADLVRARGGFAEARDGYDRAIALRQRLVEEDPKTPIYRSFLAYSLRRRGLARAGLGDVAGAAADARRALGLYEGLPVRSGGEGYETACCHAALAGLAARGGAGLSAAEAETAIGLLHQAIEMGYRGNGLFRTEAALEPLRDRADFRLLILDLVFPAEAFARDE